MTDNDQREPTPWTIELILVPSTAAITPEAKEALRGIKARRHKGDPMTCCCCLTTLGTAPFTLVLARGNDDAIQPAEAGLCRSCRPNIKAAGEKALKVVRGIWPALTGYDLRMR